MKTRKPCHDRFKQIMKLKMRYYNHSIYLFIYCMCTYTEHLLYIQIRLSQIIEDQTEQNKQKQKHNFIKDSVQN